MKQLFLFLVFLIITGVCYAQDTLYRNDHTKTKVKILEVGLETVTYKRSSNPDGPSYTVQKKDIFKIIYANGEVEYFGTDQKLGNHVAMSASQNPDSIARCNYISLNMVDLMPGVITLNFEHDLREPHASLRFSVSTGMATLRDVKNTRINELYYYNKHKIIGFAAELHYFPKGRANHFMYAGPAFGYGKVSHNYESYLGNLIEEKAEFASMGITIGCLLMRYQKINCTIATALGVQPVFRSSLNRSFMFFGRVEASLGFRFEQRKK
ncbi:MAG: hypothetical protein ACRCYO_12860 [Bacteroidia bacterium]